VAFDGLAGNSFGQREAVAALGAGDLFFGFDDDGAGDDSSSEKIRGQEIRGQGPKPADA
jgi:hypothetical protein